MVLACCTLGPHHWLATLVFITWVSHIFFFFLLLLIYLFIFVLFGLLFIIAWAHDCRHLVLGNGQWCKNTSCTLLVIRFYFAGRSGMVGLGLWDVVLLCSAPDEWHETSTTSLCFYWCLLFCYLIVEIGTSLLISLSTSCVPKKPHGLHAFVLRIPREQS